MSVATGLTLLESAQLRAFLRHCGLTPQAIDELLTRVQAGRTEWWVIK